MIRRYRALLLAIAGGVGYGFSTALAGWGHPVDAGLAVFTSVLVGAVLS